MNREGPPLEALIHRIAETPPDFLAEPRLGTAGIIQVAAVVGDLVRRLGGTPTAGELQRFDGRRASPDRNALAVTLLMCWVLADEWFAGVEAPREQLFQILDEEAAGLSAQAAAVKYVGDSDRREEMARLVLARLGYRPAGESVAQAQDRLATLSSVERARVIKAARVAEERARQIREALARKAAQEAADKWTRE